MRLALATEGPHLISALPNHKEIFRYGHQSSLHGIHVDVMPEADILIRLSYAAIIETGLPDFPGKS